MVSKFEFLDICPCNNGEHLVAQADTKDRNLAQYTASGFLCSVNLLWVTRAVGEEDTVWVVGQGVLGRCVPRYNCDLAAVCRKTLENAVLLATVVRDNIEAFLGCSRNHMRRLDGYVRDKVVLGDAGRCLDAREQMSRIQVLGGDSRLLCAKVAQMHGQRTGIDTLDGNNAVLLQKLGQALLGRPVTWLIAHVVDDKTTQVQNVSLHDRRINAVVAYLRISQRDNLAGVTWIGDNLLVAGHRRVENNLAEGLSASTTAPPLEGCSIFENKQRARLRGGTCQWIHILSDLRRSMPSHKKRALLVEAQQRTCALNAMGLAGVSHRP